MAFLKKESAEKAISEMNNKSIGGREVRTNWATSRKLPVNGAESDYSLFSL